MQNYHRHSYYSNIWGNLKDSSVANEDYAKRALELKHKVISSVEHGWQGYYYETFELAKKYNLKFIFGTEAYWTKDRSEKDKSNNHIIILAKNEKGRQAINYILSEANETGYYLRPRVDLELLFSLPANDVFVTTACIAFWKYEDTEDIVVKMKNHFKDNFMLEIQYHNCDKQIEINKKILELSNKYNIEMIVGLDSHFIYPEQKEERDNLLKDNDIQFSDEDSFYMDYPDDETVIKRFKEQGIFSEEKIIKAMNNTDLLLDFEDIYLNDDIKLPTLYPDKTQKQKNKIYCDLILEKFKEYTKNFDVETKKKYFEEIKKEISVYIKTGMVDYPLIDYQIVEEAIKNGGIITKTGRGSGVSYFTNSLCGFSKVDRITAPIKVYPERFLSESRILETRSLPDLDLNVGNPEIFAQAQEKVLGKGHSYPMIAFQTMKKKAAFKMYARIENISAEISNQITKQIADYEEDLKNAEDDEKENVDIYEYVSEEYHDVFKKSEKYQGIVSGKNQAPCAYLLYSGDIRSEIGLIRCKSETTKKEVIITVIDGMIAEKYKFLKNDLLKVDVVLLIAKTYNRIGIPHHTVNELMEIIKDNKKVWEIYEKGITVGINQCESQGTTNKVMKYKPMNLSELSAFIAGIRPSFKSMYNKFESRESFSYGIKALDSLLQTKEFPQSFILYQEQIMNVLNYSGFPMDECYSIIKAVAKKHPEKVLPLKDKFLKGFKEKIISDDNVSEEKAEETSKQVWQILSDFCAYGFNASHSLCMALDSLYCAYLKSHYPYEFYEVLLEHYSNKGNKDKVKLLKKEMLKYFNISEGKYKFGADNRKFTADKENKCINPSILSIKGLNFKISEELFELSQNNKYNNFIELLKNIKNKTSVNKTQLKILIQLGYFLEFGKSEKLTKAVEIFNKYNDKVQIKKEKLNEYELSVIPEYATETKTMYRFTDIDGYIEKLYNNIENKELPLQILLNAQSEYLGYIDIVVPKLKNLIYVMDIDIKYSPKLTCYKIDSGETIIIKMNKKTYSESQIEKGCILQYSLHLKFKMKKINNKWTTTDEKELWFDKYKIVAKPIDTSRKDN